MAEVQVDEAVAAPAPDVPPRAAAGGALAADELGVTVRARVRVRYFAAAKAAAGVGEEVRDVPDGCSISTLLAEAGLGTVPVFGRSTFLVNGVTTPDRAHPLHNGDELDVLPPFAGG